MLTPRSLEPGHEHFGTGANGMLNQRSILYFGLSALTIISFNFQNWSNAAENSASEKWDRTILPLASPPFRGIAHPTLEGSREDWPKSVKAPSGAPNILLVLIDDAGFGNPSTFGGPIQTPHLDRLAQNGLRYNSFHVTALCSPTRAALLSGRNQHSLGFGSVSEFSGGWPGYNTIWPKKAAPLARILRENGYATAAFGKWHLTPSQQLGPTGPFDQWPNRMGFDYFWGFLGGEADQYVPLLVENQKVLGPPQEKGFYLNTSLADHAVHWLKEQKSGAGDQPFFMYFATGATHAPHQVPAEWSDRYKGQFDSGWDAYRQMTFERQKKLGIIPANAKLTPRDQAFPAWDSLSDQQKKLYARQMEVYAGYQENTDHEVGRVLQEIDKLGLAENTLIITIWGDNGASMEGTETGTFNELAVLNGIQLTPEQQVKMIEKHGGLSAWGTPSTEPHYAAAWGWAGNAPFQWGKQVASHLGGTRNPMVISWPKRIKERGGLRTQFTHVTDIVPTLLEATGIPAPKKVDGIEQMPIHGVSFAHTWDHPNASSQHRKQYFEVFGNRAMYEDGWWLSCRLPRIPWEFTEKTLARFAPGKFAPDQDRCELYDLRTDYVQAHDLSKKNPSKLAHLKSLWWREAKKYQVLPLLAGISNLYGHKSQDWKAQKLTFYPGVQNISPGAAPRIFNRSWKVITDLVVPNGGAEGVIAADGDYFGGYSLYLQGGKPRFTYNLEGVQITHLVSPETISPGKAQIVYDFTADQPGRPGGGGTGVLTVNSKKVAEARFERTVPLQFNVSAGFDIGRDNGLPVIEEGEYAAKAPFAFTGQIEKVVYELGPNATGPRQLGGTSGQKGQGGDQK